MSKPKIAVIISSTRKGRLADKPAAWLMDQVKDNPDLDFEIVDLRDFPLPMFDEPASNAYMPSSNEVAKAWQEKIAGYDGYFFIVAEYNHSMTAALKNAFDYASVVWAHKPMAALAYGSMGGVRALEHLRLVAIEAEMVPVRNAVHIGGADFFTIFPMAGNQEISAIEDNIKPSLDATLADLVWWTNATKAARG